MKSANRTFYTYLWLREDGIPYYVGKGSRNRAYDSCKYHRPPKDRSRITIVACPSEKVALDYEILLIETYGRKDLGTGCLRNLTPGGENLILSAESRLKGDKKRKGMKRSSNFRKRMREVNPKGRALSQETRNRMSISRSGPRNPFYGKKPSKEALEKNRAAHTGKKWTDKQYETHAGKHWSPATEFKKGR